MHVARRPEAAEVAGNVIALLARCIANQGCFNQDVQDAWVIPELPYLASAEIFRVV